MDDEIYLVVNSIDLLTIDEAKKLPKNVRAMGDWWWLRSADGNPDNAASVDPYGSIELKRDDRIFISLCIRPALLIENLDSLHLHLYTILEIFDKEWIYIGNNKALVKDYIGTDSFNENYTTSRIKKELDDWLIKKKQEFEED